mmetsp:Transcript_21024/g.64050  ORF Transcript_21024/g.64050 Transcript_21024/m.64050 type:complete len:377 (-) Transcript_21024:315-1445(-)
MILQALLGSGTEGVIYVAAHRDTGRHIALKIYRDAQAPLVEVLRLQNQELQHECILLNQPVVEKEGRIKVAISDLCEQDLLDMVQKQKPARLTRDQAYALAAQSCSGLAHAHEEGWYHLDLKPENIFMNTAENGGLQMRVADWGCATKVMPNGDCIPHSKICGTAMYWPPEVIAKGGRTSDEESLSAVDSWSLGVTILTLATGRHPWDYAIKKDEQFRAFALLRRELTEALRQKRGKLSDAATPKGASYAQVLAKLKKLLGWPFNNSADALFTSVLMLLEIDAARRPSLTAMRPVFQRLHARNSARISRVVAPFAEEGEKDVLCGLVSPGTKRRHMDLTGASCPPAPSLPEDGGKRRRVERHPTQYLSSQSTTLSM